MLCIFNANGGLFSVTPSQVYQGSNKASTIQLLAPIDSTVLMQVSFTLPNGKVTKPVPVSLATETGYSGIEDEHGNKVFLWEYEVPFAITSYAGKVKTQFKALNGQGQVISTMSFYFDVLEGNASTEVEEIDNYEALIEYLQQLNLAWANNYNYLLQNSWQLGNLSFLNLQEHSTLASVTTPATYMFSGQSDAPPDVSTGILYNVAYMGSFASLQVVFAVSYKTAKPQYYPPKLFIRTISNSTPSEWAEIANLKDIENIVSNLNYNIEDGSGEKAVQQKGTQANADNSASFGLETVANTKGQVVVGVANDSQSEDVFEVGNGEVDESGNVISRSNAFRVLKDGRAKMPNGTGTDNDDVVNQFGLKLKLDPILTDLDNVLNDFESFSSEMENAVNALLEFVRLALVFIDSRQLSLSFDNYFSAQDYFRDTPPNFMPDEFPTELPYIYVGQSVYIKELNVPDLWISNIFEELDGYYAETNEELIAKLEQNGSLRIGYYELSPLETGKVDLQDYVKFTDYATSDGTKAGIVQLKAYGGGGLDINSENKLVVQPASTVLILRRGYDRPLGPANLDDLMAIGVTGKKEVSGTTTYGNQVPLTDEEKGYACDWLGALKTVDTTNILYGNGQWGNKAYNVGTSDAVSRPGYIPIYHNPDGGMGTEDRSHPDGIILCAVPKNPYQSANKKYVDDLLATTTKLYKHYVVFSGSNYKVYFYSTKNTAYSTISEFLSAIILGENVLGKSYSTGDMVFPILSIINTTQLSYTISYCINATLISATYNFDGLTPQIEALV